MDDFRRLFLRGLAALVPTLLTFAILIWVYGFVNTHIGFYIDRGLMAICRWISPEPREGLIDELTDTLKYGVPIDEWTELGDRLTVEYKVIHHRALSHTDEKVRKKAEVARSEALWKILFEKYHLNLLGFLIAIVLVYFLGFFLASFIGRTSWRLAEGLLYRVPLIRAVYPNVKQVTDFLLAERRIEFAGVVAVQYPRLGTWSLGLRTGDAMKSLQKATPETLATVFVPSSPTPFTGYVVHVPAKEVVELDLSIDEALRFLISGGVIRPEHGSFNTASAAIEAAG